VVKSAKTTIIVCPGDGDDIQAIKAGILEVGDIFVINKADREGSDKTLNELRQMIDMASRSSGRGSGSAYSQGRGSVRPGVAELLEAIENTGPI